MLYLKVKNLKRKNIMPLKEGFSDKTVFEKRPKRCPEVDHGLSQSRGPQTAYKGPLLGASWPKQEEKEDWCG